MQCERCKFENIPGKTVCMKCGSVLQAGSDAFEIYPPRMPKWEKSFRDLLRAIRKNRVIIYTNTVLHTPKWLKELMNDKAMGLLLCLVPGLAHILSKRFKEIWIYFTAWLVLLLSGLFLYGSRVGYALIGLAIGAHIGIMIKYGLFKDMDNFREKAATMFLAMLGVLFLYGLVPNFILPHINLSRSTLTIPSYNIAEGDTLISSTNIDRRTLARGALVLVYPQVVGGHNVRAQLGINTVIAEIVALPGENLQIDKDVFVINGNQLDTKQYPVPGWLQNSNFSCIIPDKCYFISAQYRAHVHGQIRISDYIAQISIVARDDIEAKAFMLWLPVTKRGFLQE